MIEKKGIVENEEDMETSVYRDSCPDHDFNCITDHIGSSSGNTVLDVNRLSRMKKMDIRHLSISCYLPEQESIRRKMLRLENWRKI